MFTKELQPNIAHIWLLSNCSNYILKNVETQADWYLAFVY